MGMRAQAIDEILRKRRPRPNTSFSEMGQRPPLSTGEMSGLASALSGMSAGAGNYGGRIPQSPGFQEALKYIADQEKTDEDRIYKDIELAGLAQEQQRLLRRLDPSDRDFLQSKLKEAGIERTLPEDYTYQDAAENIFFSQFMGPKTNRIDPFKQQQLQFQQDLQTQKLDLAKERAEAARERGEKSSDLAEANLEIRRDQINQQRLDRAERKKMETQARNEKAEKERIARLEKGARQLSVQIDKSGFPTMWNVFDRIEAALPPKGQDIPGFGQTGMVPKFALSAEGKRLRQEIASLFNITLKDRSGAAVTIPELERLKEEFGSGSLNTDEQLRQGLEAAKEGLQRETQNIMAGYSPDIYEFYVNENMGIPLWERVPDYQKKQGKAGSPPEELEEWKP